MLVEDIHEDIDEDVDEDIIEDIEDYEVIFIISEIKQVYVSHFVFEFLSSARHVTISHMSSEDLMGLRISCMY